MHIQGWRPKVGSDVFLSLFLLYSLRHLSVESRDWERLIGQLASECALPAFWRLGLQASHPVLGSSWFEEPELKASGFHYKHFTPWATSPRLDLKFFRKLSHNCWRSSHFIASDCLKHRCSHKTGKGESCWEWITISSVGSGALITGCHLADWPHCLSALCRASPPGPRMPLLQPMVPFILSSQHHCLMVDSVSNLALSTSQHKKTPLTSQQL